MSIKASKLHIRGISGYSWCQSEVGRQLGSKHGSAYRTLSPFLISAELFRTNCRSDFARSDESGLDNPCNHPQTTPQAHLPTCILITSEHGSTSGTKSVHSLLLRSKHKHGKWSCNAGRRYQLKAHHGTYIFSRYSCIPSLP
jgi:hypothetical protein